jgi:alanine racemase
MHDPRNRFLSWVEVDLPALRHNLGVFRSLLAPGARLLLVVKANAYGHGLTLVAGRAEECGADALGVHSLEEAASARAAGWRGMLLVLGYVPRVLLAEGADLEIDFTVYDPAVVSELDRIGRARGRPVPCHLKLETGTHRQGIAEEDLEAFLNLFGESPGVRLRGISTHFANIEDTTDHGYARSQLERFLRMSEQVRRAGFEELLRHTACTAAVLTMPETGFEMARVGIGAYGIWPSRETLAAARTRGDGGVLLRPVLRWMARIAQVKWVPAGAFIGYGCAYRTSHRTRIAVVPVGYSEGYDRSLSGLAHVLIRGSRAPVVGRICMNMFLCDVTDIEGAGAEDPVVLLGRDGAEEIRASDLAAMAQTIPYEIVSRISPALARVAVDGTGAVVPAGPASGFSGSPSPEASPGRS